MLMHVKCVAGMSELLLKTFPAKTYDSIHLKDTKGPRW